MHLEKLVTALKSLDEQRLKRLKEYVSSPYFHIPPVCTLLLERLISLHPGFPEKKMQWQNIGKNIRTLSTLSKQWNAGTHLLRAVEDFLAQEEWQKNKAEVMRCRLKGLKGLSLTAEFEKQFTKKMEQLKKDPEQHLDIFFERHLLTELSFNGFDARLDRTTRNDLMPVVKTLDEFYALKKLRYLCEALNRQQMLGVSYTAEPMAPLLKILEPYTHPEYAYVYLFVNAHHMMTSETYEDCDLYYQLIKQLANRMGPSPAIREVMGYAINRSLYWNNRGHDAAGSEYLWWIEWRMSHQLLLDKGKLMPVTFRNMVSIAAINKMNPSSIKQMIDTYAPCLPEEYHDTYLAFANGLYYYTGKKYKEAIRHFLLAQAKEVAVFNSIIRMWHWRCLYEYDRNDTDALINHLLSFEKYLHRNRNELKHVAQAFGLFIGYAMKLLKGSAREMQYSHLSDLQTEEHFPSKPWLVEQYGAKNRKPVRVAHG